LSVAFWIAVGMVGAGPYVIDVAEPKILPIGGGWAHAVRAEDGWHFFFAAGGEYWRLPMSEDFEVRDYERIGLTGRDDLIDHSLQNCPDGTYLHLATANPDFSGEYPVSFTYDEEFNLVSGTTLGEVTPDRIYHDLPAACEEGGSWTAFLVEFGTNELVELNALGEPVASFLIEDVMPPLGGTLIEDLTSGELLLISGVSTNSITVTAFGDDLAPRVVAQRNVVPNGEKVYFTQAALRLKNHIIVAFMVQPENDPYVADSGNLGLVIFDKHWNIVENLILSDNPVPWGGQRPSLARKKDTLLVLYDRQASRDGPVQPELFVLTLDLDAFEADSQTGSDSGAPADTGAEPDSPQDTSPEFETQHTAAISICGCGSLTPVPSWGWLAGLALVWRRRRAIRPK
jgi:hypothetical protein